MERGSTEPTKTHSEADTLWEDAHQSKHEHDQNRRPNSKACLLRLRSRVDRNAGSVTEEGSVSSEVKGSRPCLSMTKTAAKSPRAHRRPLFQRFMMLPDKRSTKSPSKAARSLFSTSSRQKPTCTRPRVPEVWGHQANDAESKENGQVQETTVAPSQPQAPRKRSPMS